MNFRKVLPAVFALAAFALVACSNDSSSSPADGGKDSAVETPDQKRDPDYLYDLDAVPEITITVTEDNWNEFLENFDKDKDNTLYVPAKWTFKKGKDVYERDSVGLRPRGNWSRVRPEGKAGEKHKKKNADWHHAHFGIKFTKYESGERFFGSDRLVLKWFHGDPSYAREIFCYDLFRRFGVWSVPRSSYARLTLQVEGDEKPAYYGVYEIIEGVRKGWLKDRMKAGYIPDNEGFMWKAAYTDLGPANLSDFDSTGTSKMGVGVSEENFSFPYTLKTNKTELAAAQDELFDFMENMRPLKDSSDELKEYLEKHMDVDLFVRSMAVDAVVGVWDNYWVNSNNYYFYFDKNHKFYFIPYDYDNTLGTTKPIQNIENAGTQDPLNYGSMGEDRMLIKKVFSIKEYADSYKDYLKELVTSKDLMEPDAAMERMKGFQDLIKDYVENDTGEDMVVEDKSRIGESTIDYKLFSGDDKGGDGSNYFRTKARVVQEME